LRKIPINEFKRRWRSTPFRTFVVYPVVVAVASICGSGGRRWPDLRFVPLMVWGYFQYRLCGDYRQRLHAGSRGMEAMPDRLITTGPYAYTRNPMYLGHLLFLFGLALVSRSWLAWSILLASKPWYQLRVFKDEARLREQFGAEYEEYCRTVKRWIPFVL